MLLVSHDRALLDAIAERTLAIEDGELHAYDGGWAEMLRRRQERAARAQAAESKPKAGKAEAKKLGRVAQKVKQRPAELDRIEADIAAREAEVAELEAKLADNWTDVDLLAAHKRARDGLAALLERWEALFEAQTERA